jgi:hypothetical protein
MSLGGSRGLIRISKNPGCELQAALAVRGIKEKDFYERYTGEPFPGEYGERQSARRRGAMFERNLHKDGAAILRRALADRFKSDADSMKVLDFEDEIPGTSRDARLARRDRTVSLLQQLAAGESRIPDLLIQPVLPLRVTESSTNYLVPDFLLLDRSQGIFVPGEEKSFIVRDNVADSADLDGARRQAGAEVVGLRQAAQGLGIGDRVRNRAIFVFASPYGLSPARPFVENLDAEVHEIEHALATAAAVADKLKLLAVEKDVERVAAQFSRNYTDECVRSCGLADVCARECAGAARTLGDAAAQLVGPDMPIARVYELMRGAEPRTERERQVAPRLRELTEAFAALGI